MFFKRNLGRILAIAHVFNLLSCAVAPTSLSKSVSRSEFESGTPTHIVVRKVDEQETLRKIDKFESILRLRGKSLTASDWKLHDDLLAVYAQLKSGPLHGTTMRVPPRSRLKIDLQSYCLDSSKAVPAEKERYSWIKRDPDIPYFREILKFGSENQIKQTDAQTLLWNLQNKTEWENYPEDLKAILKKIDTNAPVKLPSRLKSQAKDAVIDYLKNQVPYGQEVEDKFSFLEGQYYQYQDFARRLHELRSNEPIEVSDDLVPVPSSPLATEIHSDGYLRQEITFYNPTNSPQQIDLSDYYLQPKRSDVQRIGLAGDPSYKNETLSSRLEKVLYHAMARLGVGFTPLLGDVADIYELLAGKDFLSGEGLTWGERLLSGVGVIAGSGAGYRYAMRATYVPEELIPQFEKGFQQIAKKEIGLSGRELSETKALIAQTKITERAIQASPTLRNTFERPNFKKTDFYVRPNGEVIPAKGYRYVSSDAPYLKNLSETGMVPAKVDGNYISFKNFNSTKGVASELQVPHDASIKVEFDTKQVLEDVKIPNGNWGKADWLEPITKDHPRFGEGGAYQAITSQRIKATRITDLKTGRVLYDSK
ncbi:MAG: pre-toxin TG domain-containing protein [Bdellovibrionales bacterium]